MRSDSADSISPERNWSSTAAKPRTAAKANFRALPAAPVAR